MVNESKARVKYERRAKTRIESFKGAVEAVQKMSKPATRDMIAQVSTIADNSDDTIGGIIAEAVKKVGKDTVITVEESKTIVTELTEEEARRYLSRYCSESRH